MRQIIQELLSVMGMVVGILTSIMQAAWQLFEQQATKLSSRWNSIPDLKLVIAAVITVIVIGGIGYVFWWAERILGLVGYLLASILAVFFVLGVALGLMNILLDAIPNSMVATK